MEEDTKDKFRYAWFALRKLTRGTIKALRIIGSIFVDARAWDKVKRSVPQDLYKPRYKIENGEKIRIIEYPGFTRTDDELSLI